MSQKHLPLLTLWWCWRWGGGRCWGGDLVLVTVKCWWSASCGSSLGKVWNMHFCLSFPCGFYGSSMQKQEQKPHSEASQLGRFITKLRKEEAHQLSGPGRGGLSLLERNQTKPWLQLRKASHHVQYGLWSLECLWWASGGKMAFLCCQLKWLLGHLWGPCPPTSLPRAPGCSAHVVSPHANSCWEQKCISVFNKLDIYVN